ncbi:MAG: hypothetical protein QUV20_15645 [Oceanibaculum nanhaiense]|uniref:nucleoside-diphosphate sugar epimerase/dehydratase n=1 Tax=Oceanibaculum nanhaiense TaxID=1909734 RepID=UPI0025A40048|nr:hypothetical protein [Oceanibaculum nanhaiense]MDM7947760.1 hypothetical protein [Oceanibaculum nanhaiense]
MKLPSGLRLAIFGAGSSGRAAYALLRRGNSIAGFLDSDPAKQGQEIDGVPILPPEALATLEHDRVVIASMFDTEIAALLTGPLGVPETRLLRLPAYLLKARSAPSGEASALALFARCFDMLHESGIPYFADHSLLLGIMRENGLIPWARELDLCIMEEDVPALREVLRAQGAAFDFEEIGYRNSTECWARGEARMFKAAAAEIDIHVKHRVADSDGEWRVWCVGPYLLQAGARHYAAASWQDFNGVPVRCPADPEAYLEAMYGSWRVKVKNWSYGDYRNIRATYPADFL